MQRIILYSALATGLVVAVILLFPSAASRTVSNSRPAAIGETLPVTTPTTEGSTMPPATVEPTAGPTVEGEEVAPEQTNTDVAPRTASGSDSLCDLLVDGLRNGRGNEVLATSRQLMAMGDAAVPDLCVLLNCGDKALETAAFSILTRMANGQSIAAALGKILSTKDVSYRTMLTKQFAGVQTPALIDLLIKMMLETNQESLHAGITDILSAMEGRYVVDALSKRMEQLSSPAEAEDCAAAMARLGKPSLVPALREVLASSVKTNVQAAAARGLASIGNSKAIEVLVQCAENGSGPSAACLVALPTVRSPYGQESLLNIGKGGSTPEIRTAALRALGNYRSSYIKEEVSKLAASEPNGAVRTAMEECMTSIDKLLANGQKQQLVGGEE